MAIHHIKIQKTARYAMLNTPGPHIKQVLFALHGYGNLADEFIQKLAILDDGKTLIVAPEGLHRFYRKGYHGAVGASWMTKEDRITDIADYINYLNQLYNEIMPQLKQPEITVLGFSQGVATASRWMSSGQSPAQRFVSWASVFPPDLNFEIDKAIFQKMQVLLVYGDQDEFIDKTQIEAQRQLLDQFDIKYKVIIFEGKHEIKKETLGKIFGT